MAEPHAILRRDPQQADLWKSTFNRYATLALTCFARSEPPAPKAEAKTEASLQVPQSRSSNLTADTNESVRVRITF